MKKVLVTGGAGYIGSTVANELIQANYQVTVFDNLSRGFLKLVPKKAQWISGDLLKKSDIENAFKQNQFDVVMHFAALAQVNESVLDPRLYYQNNVLGTLNLLDTMLKFECKKIIFSSTCAIFGIPTEIPISENLPKNPISPYGTTKLAIEHAMEAYHQAYGMNYVALRYFNAAGGSKERGEMHEPETHLIPNVFKAITSQAPIKIFGNDYPTPDGTCIRDYIHILDLAQAHMLALEFSGTQVFNLGSGKGYSNLEVLKTAEKVTGAKIPFEWAARRSGDPAILIASNEVIQKTLGWKPHYDLQQIIQSAWTWHQICSQNPTSR